MKKITILLASVCLASMLAATSRAETMKTRFGKLQFTSGYPTKETAQKLYDELDFQRAVQAYLWALPMASYGAMADEHIRLGCGSSAVLIADQFAQQRHLALTANQDTIYMSGVLDLRNGPMVMEIPAGLLGTLNNIWQQPLCDLGGPFSPEQNRDGRFLILPPVNSFWSLTMYALPASLLVANPIDRYLLNSPMLPDFVRDADGGSTLYTQHDSPGKARETNWLPAPKGPFSGVMRLYWPKAQALDGTWKLPPLKRAE